MLQIIGYGVTSKFNWLRHDKRNVNSNAIKLGDFVSAVILIFQFIIDSYTDP